MTQKSVFAAPPEPLTLDAIRDHYDKLSPLYRLLWGEHIHHGLWRGKETPAQAQENLTRELARHARVSASDHVLDIGCGLGGSALLLAAEIGCQVDGITISPVQVKSARQQAKRRGLAAQARFEVQDANLLGTLPLRAYDVIWVVECSEHLFDKPAFIATCARWLKPGGRLAVCTWLTGEKLSVPQQGLVDEVLRGMLCPSFGTLREYVGWMETAGLRMVTAQDLTAEVGPTWERCRQLLNFPLVRKILARRDQRLREFAASFTSIDEAYRCGAMGYGMMVAEKPRVAER